MREGGGATDTDHFMSTQKTEGRERAETEFTAFIIYCYLVSCKPIWVGHQKSA